MHGIDQKVATTVFLRKGGEGSAVKLWSSLSIKDKEEIISRLPAEIDDDIILVDTTGSNFLCTNKKIILFQTLLVLLSLK